MKKKLLIVTHTQYGYLIDYAQYCKYLKSDFDITFLCWDYQNKKNQEPGINIQYISRVGNIITRNIRFISFAINHINLQIYSFVFINYFKGCSFIPIYCKSGSVLHLDIRTGDVSSNKVRRIINNNILRFESKFFKSISIISIGLRHMLRINKNAHILPLGANPIYLNRQSKHKIHLLYVGTLTSRRIEDTIEGMKFFLERLPQADIHYTIIGNGWHKEEENLLRIVNQLELQEYIELTGYIPNNELQQYYEMANVGVSYIPMTPYYKFQPATKTFEYLMAGMPVIATKTHENSKVINQLNGVLISDNAKSFADGIEQIYNFSSSFDENKIRQTVQNYDWSIIIKSMKNTILQ